MQTNCLFLIQGNNIESLMYNQVVLLRCTGNPHNSGLKIINGSVT